MRRMLRVLVAFGALACAASVRRPASREDAEPERETRLSGLVARRLARRDVPRHVPVGTALPFAATRRPDRSGEDVQVNDAARDAAYDFPDAKSPTAPFFAVNQSETSLAVSGRTIVVTYNDAAGVAFTLVDGVPRATVYDFVGFATSLDGGRSWRTGSLPAPPDGYIDADNAVDVDRGGRFYAATLSDTDARTYSVAVSRSDDGLSWSTPAVPSVEQSDKPWLAVGPDPSEPSRDVVYVTWTRFQRTGAHLRLARSSDRGSSWTVSTLLPPGPDPAPVQFTNPAVDRKSGRLYVSYVRSGTGQMYVEMVESGDGGTSFTPVRFPFASPSPERIAFDPPGDVCNCAGLSLAALHAGPNLAPPSAAPFYVRTWWIGFQPSVAASGDLLALAWGARTGARADVFLTVSRDRGSSWSTPLRVNPLSGDGVQHAESVVAIDDSTGRVHVTYYTQHADETYDVDLATLGPADGYASVSTMRLTTRPSTIPPSNVGDGTAEGVNFDGIWGPCYSQGHYMMLRAENGNVHAAWADGRNPMTHPVNARDPLSGVTHAQSDVYYRRVRP